jgi:dTDP-4-dehydrorhamnose reductase
MKKILVLGSNGMLGYGVTAYFKKNSYNVTGLGRSEFDVTKHDISTIEKYIDGSDLVINCIGVIKPMIEKNTALDVLKVNCIFPQNLAKLCKKNNVKLIHVTTDCVFSGKTGNYNETDLYDADDLYGISKNGGDGAGCMVLRTSFVGPENGRSRSLLEWAFSQKGKSVNGFTNHRWNGVSSIYFAEIAGKILNENLYNEGIYHLYSPDTVAKFELLKIFDKVFNLGLKISPVEASVKCDRSLSSIHNLSSKIAAKTIESQITELKQFFNL